MEKIQKDKAHRLIVILMELALLLCYTTLAIIFIMSANVFNYIGWWVIGLFDMCLVYEGFILWKDFFKHLKGKYEDEEDTQNC